MKVKLLLFQVKLAHKLRFELLNNWVITFFWVNKFYKLTLIGNVSLMKNMHSKLYQYP